MGLVDAFGKEDRVEIKMSDLFALLKAGARSELVMNAVNCNFREGGNANVFGGKR